MSLAHDGVLTGLRDNDVAYIYHCLNHYFVVVGYEQSPLLPIDAYAGTSSRLLCCLVCYAVYLIIRTCILSGGRL